MKGRTLQSGTMGRKGDIYILLIENKLGIGYKSTKRTKTSHRPKKHKKNQNVPLSQNQETNRKTSHRPKTTK